MKYDCKRKSSFYQKNALGSPDNVFFFFSPPLKKKQKQSCFHMVWARQMQNIGGLDDSTLNLFMSKFQVHFKAVRGENLGDTSQLWYM